MDGFKLGFMPSFNSDLLEQINFAKANFDFLELTLSYDLKEWTPEYVAIVKKSLGSLPIVGHNHWGIDLTATDGAEKTIEAFEILHALGVRKIVIHPSFPENIDPAEPEVPEEPPVVVEPEPDVPDSPLEPPTVEPDPEPPPAAPQVRKLICIELLKWVKSWFER